ncbi:hypothetical protein [Paraburkholderia unamae]|uniref:hypothetical protein n=1 Tax=Paraburkholderia unamae TaxID=219649 RepID=UPI001CC34FDF|nr:hypothetical protein [Paraburkholderia unamae]
MTPARWPNWFNADSSGPAAMSYCWRADANSRVARASGPAKAGVVALMAKRASAAMLIQWRWRKEGAAGCDARDATPWAGECMFEKAGKSRMKCCSHLACPARIENSSLFSEFFYRAVKGLPGGG